MHVSLKARFGNRFVRVLRMGTTYGGVLSEVGSRHRDGGTGCPVCDDDRFEPIRLERWVRCASCATVFVQRRPKQLADVLGGAWKEMSDSLLRKNRRQ